MEISSISQQTGALHLIEGSDGWTVIEEEGGAEHLFDTKSQALRYAKHLALEKGIELIVHGADGSVQERDIFIR